MKINSALILLVIVPLFSSCIKEFLPHVDRYEELLVVEGAITDKSGPYTVKLSKSGDVREFSKYQPYSNCLVEILDDLGNTEILTEVAEGVYKTDSLGMQGVVGRKYKVKISAPDGRLYESYEEVLKSGAGIDSVYGEVEYKNNPTLPYRREGLQFYTDVENVLETPSYYLWFLESTYKFRVDLPVTGSPFKECYRTQIIKEIYTLNTAEQSQHQGMRTLLNYEDNYSKALTMRYSLKVNQYTLNERAYTFWNTLKKMNADQGSLYTQQPFQVRGNVINMNDPGERVLGYFMVAGMDEKRMFVDRPPIIFRYSVCVEDTGPNAVPAAPACYDCRVDGYLKKPDFWID